MTISDDKEIKYIVDVDWPQDTPMPIPFPLDSKEDLKIQEQGNLLIYGIDYEVNEYKTEVIVKDRTLSAGSVLFRSTPLTQEAEFPQNNKFNSAKLNEALDKLTMQQQEQDEILGRTFQLDRATVYGEFKPIIKEIKPDGLLKITEDGTALEVSEYSPESLIEETQQYTNQAKEYKNQAIEAATEATATAQQIKDYIDTAEDSITQFVTQTEDNITQFVTQTEDNLTTFIEQSKDDIQMDIDSAEELIIDLEHILDTAAIGLSEEYFSIENWVYDSTKQIYRYKISKLAAAIGVFKGEIFNKYLVNNISIIYEEDGIYLEAIQPFAGAVVGTPELIESEEEVYTTSELLDQMLDVEVIDITNSD